MGALILRIEQGPRVACSSKLPCLGGHLVNKCFARWLGAPAFRLNSVFELRRHFNCFSVLYPAFLPVSFLCYIVAQGKREIRGDQACKLVLDFNRILSSAVARCLLVFAIQWEDKDYTRKRLKECWASRTGIL